MAGRSPERIQVGFAYPTLKALLALAEEEGNTKKATMVQILVEEALIARGKLDPSRRSVHMPSDLESVDAEEAAKPVEQSFTEKYTQAVEEKRNRSTSIGEALKVAQDKGFVYTSHGRFKPDEQIPAEAQVASDLDQQILDQQEKLIQLREAQLLQLQQMQAQRAAAIRS